MQNITPRRPVIFAWLSLLAAVLCFPLIAFGAIVRLNDAGLACPDWPLCFGQVTPLGDVLRPDPAQVRVALEVGHRYVAGILGVLVLVLAALTWVGDSQLARLRARATLAVFLLLPQAVLGGLTVLMELHALTVALHMVFGTLFFASLVWLALGAWRVARQTNMPATNLSPLYQSVLYFTASLTILQVFWGGLVSGSGASMACVGFPECNGSYAWPEFMLSQLHYIHRVLGLSLAALLAGLAMLGQRDPTVPRRASRAGWALAGLVGVQILLGWYNVVHFIPTATAVAHTATAAAMVGLLTYLIDVDGSFRLHPRMCALTATAPDQ